MKPSTIIIIAAVYLIGFIFWLIVHRKFGYGWAASIFKSLVWPVVFPIYIYQWIKSK